MRFLGYCGILNCMENYTLIRSRRRTLALEITRDCRLLVRAPLRCSEGTIRDFVARNQTWIERHMAKVRQRAAQAGPPPTEEEIDALKARARTVLPDKVAHYAEVMGLSPTGLKVTSAQKRYGSCSAKNSLCFSCYLMRSPDEAIDAVVVHELAHIRYKNHGKEFYALIHRYMPDYQARKKLLK
ncbi:M48 family metallopeptidase [Oscillibacter ruminantium]|uniref:M48 family metallopeptidase n=1 Tax=Oscillibacter ruminantium TaxID=1263547 RepID=UPI0033293A60